MLSCWVEDRSYLVLLYCDKYNITFYLNPLKNSFNLCTHSYKARKQEGIYWWLSWELGYETQDRIPNAEAFFYFRANSTRQQTFCTINLDPLFMLLLLYLWWHYIHISSPKVSTYIFNHFFHIIPSKYSCTTTFNDPITILCL